jgi:23S rRNA pseudouridine1911/1915/1917 synthase
MPTAHIVERPAELLAYLIASCPKMKRAKLLQWLKHGSIQVNGRFITRFNHPLQAGDMVLVHTKKEALADALLPPSIKVSFEDASLVVIEKSEGLLSIASETERRKTAYAFLTDYVRRDNPRSPERVWIVHRLDRDASGLMVFAKTELAKRAMQSHWYEADKRYLAVVEGHPPADEGVLTSHLNESSPLKVYSAPPSEQTRHAVTTYRVVKRNTTRTLIELTLKTGRRNQIRVQLADAECPIVGDRKYGARTNPARRLGLHASSLQFKHPSLGELVRFESFLPQDLAELV